MSCYRTLLTKNLQGEVVEIPCGQCIGCRLEKSRQWAMRCVNEASLYKENCFVTLTYNDKHLPPHGTLKKEHLQNFIKRLRKKYEPKTIRYYGAGEYGEEFDRPHYHICLFNHNFDDRYEIRSQKFKRWKNRWSKAPENALFRSPTLEKLWTFGFSSIGEVTQESAGYTARYTLKKIMGTSKEAKELRKIRYQNRIPEFSLMSRKPGIGIPWLLKYMSDIYPKDYLMMHGHRMKPPRLYDDYYAKKNPLKMEELKKLRQENKIEYEFIRLRELEDHKKLTIKRLKRTL